MDYSKLCTASISDKERTSKTKQMYQAALCKSEIESLKRGTFSVTIFFLYYWNQGQIVLGKNQIKGNNNNFYFHIEILYNSQPYNGAVKKKKLLFYSQGNFLFYVEFEHETGGLTRSFP